MENNTTEKNDKVAYTAKMQRESVLKILASSLPDEEKENALKEFVKQNFQSLGWYEETGRYQLQLRTMADYPDGKGTEGIPIEIPEDNTLYRLIMQQLYNRRFDKATKKQYYKAEDIYSKYSALKIAQTALMQKEHRAEFEQIEELPTIQTNPELQLRLRQEIIEPQELQYAIYRVFGRAGDKPETEEWEFISEDGTDELPEENGTPLTEAEIEAGIFDDGSRNEDREEEKYERPTITTEAGQGTTVSLGTEAGD